MTTTLHPQTTVGQLVAERPARSRVFEKLGIDYCCGGKLPLAEACSRKGLDAASVLATLSAMEELGAGDDEREPSPLTMTMTELCDHIEATHHAYLRREMPRLDFMTNKVASRHGEHFPWLFELAEVYQGLQNELTAHMMKEEQILFPAIRDLEAGRPPQSPCGAHLDGPIAVMEHEHDNAGRALERMRELSGDYTPQAEACNTFRAMLDALAELEADMHRHVHKENNVLFPRAQALAGGNAR